jgi:hypothetical protein
MVAGAFSPFATIRAAAQITYYVATTGSNSNNGTSPNTPVATISYAATHTVPGDTVLVEDGTYSLPDGGFRGDVAISSSGVAGKPITYKAQNKWGAKLIGTGTGDGSVVVGVSGSYNVIQDFEITGTNAGGINLATAGTTTSYNQAIGNYVHDIVAPCDGNGGVAVNSGGGNNYDAGVGHMDILSNLIVNVTDPQGCTAPHGAGIFAAIPYTMVANNIIINGGHWAIESWHNAHHETYFGNVIINSKQSITMGAGDSPNTGTVNDYSLVQNNIVFNSSMTAIAETGSTGPHNQYIDNLVYGGDTNISLNNGLHATGTANADPMFVNNTGTAAGNYEVQSGSPARGTGLSLAGVMTDYEGAARPQSGATVIGACIGLGTSTTPPGTTTPGPGTGTGTRTGPVAAGASASPLSIVSGQPSVIAWTTKNAVSATLNGARVALNGSLTVTPTATTTYKIIATGSTGTTDWGSATVTVTTAPTGRVAAGASASPTAIVSGQSAFITWTTKNAVSATLNGTAVALNGSLAVRPTMTTTYKIVATGSNGTTDWGSATVRVM